MEFIVSNSKDPQDYEQDFSSTSFWDKVKSQAAKAGRELIEKGLVLYYTWEDSDTPTWAKATIVGALGYFISPIDAVPDVLPVVGYSDDLAVLVGALAAVASSIKKSHQLAAKEKVDDIFGES
jgi:uncharacterized membrane protein YkvA (DUF1232 family)